MKKIYLIIVSFFVSLVSVAQDQNYVKDTILVPATVLTVSGDEALIVSRNYADHFKISTPGLIVGKEYRFSLVYDSQDRDFKHCSGCTGILPARVLGFTFSELQVKRDVLKLSGYSRSPRYGN